MDQVLTRNEPESTGSETWLLDDRMPDPNDQTGRAIPDVRDPALLWYLE